MTKVAVATKGMQQDLKGGKKAPKLHRGPQTHTRALGRPHLASERPPAAY